MPSMSRTPNNEGKSPSLALTTRAPKGNNTHMPDKTIHTRCQHFRLSSVPAGPFTRLSIMFSHKSCCEIARRVFRSPHR